MNEKQRPYPCDNENHSFQAGEDETIPQAPDTPSPFSESIAHLLNPVSAHPTTPIESQHPDNNVLMVLDYESRVEFFSATSDGTNRSAQLDQVIVTNTLRQMAGKTPHLFFPTSNKAMEEESKVASTTRKHLHEDEPIPVAQKVGKSSGYPDLDAAMSF